MSCSTNYIYMLLNRQALQAQKHRANSLKTYRTLEIAFFSRNVIQDLQAQWKTSHNKSCLFLLHTNHNKNALTYMTLKPTHQAFEGQNCCQSLSSAFLIHSFVQPSPSFGWQIPQDSQSDCKHSVQLSILAKIRKFSTHNYWTSIINYKCSHKFLLSCAQKACNLYKGSCHGCRTNCIWEHVKTWFDWSIVCCVRSMLKICTSNDKDPCWKSIKRRSLPILLDRSDLGVSSPIHCMPQGPSCITW